MDAWDPWKYMAFLTLHQGSSHWQPPSHSFILHLVIEHLLFSRSLQGTKCMAVDECGSHKPSLEFTNSGRFHRKTHASGQGASCQLALSAWGATGYLVAHHGQWASERTSNLAVLGFLTRTTCPEVPITVCV